jgi:hypothetical protein
MFIGVFATLWERPSLAAERRVQGDSSFCKVLGHKISLEFRSAVYKASQSPFVFNNHCRENFFALHFQLPHSFEVALFIPPA